MSAGAKCDANANGKPSVAANWALKRLEPSSQIGTRKPAPGTARTRWPGVSGAKYDCNSLTCSGKSSPFDLLSAQSPRGGHVCSRRASEAKIDAARVERLQRAELFGNHQRSVVRQHDAASADANLARATRNVANHHRGGRASDPGHAVVLRYPIAAVAPALHVLRQVQRIAQRLRGSRSRRNGRQIKHRERNHRRLPAQTPLARTIKTLKLDCGFTRY